MTFISFLWYFLCQCLFHILLKIIVCFVLINTAYVVVIVNANVSCNSTFSIIFSVSVKCTNHLQRELLLKSINLLNIFTNLLKLLVVLFFRLTLYLAYTVIFMLEDIDLHVSILICLIHVFYVMHTVLNGLQNALQHTRITFLIFQYSLSKRLTRLYFVADSIITLITNNYISLTLNKSS